MDYVEQWYRNLVGVGSGEPPLHIEREAWGEYRKHSGPAVRFARVRIAISPADDLVIDDSLNKDKLDYLKRENCYDQIAFGVLDVMMTSLPFPMRNFRLAVLDVEYDEVTSVPMAFRLAARDAARRILSEQDKQS